MNTMTTNEHAKLDAGQKHLLRLVRKGAEADGWAPVSATVYPHAKTALPHELATLEPVGEDGRGRARLTPAGEALLDAMEWL
jgi:hypothetical protein